MTAQQFRKKPVVIEAMQWVGTAGGAIPIIAWVLNRGATARHHDAEPGISRGGFSMTIPEFLAIDTLEGTMKAFPGDWIIRGVKGEFYPCKPEIFAATYEAVEAAS